jgi:hypothetical protein
VVIHKYNRIFFLISNHWRKFTAIVANDQIALAWKINAPKSSPISRLWSRSGSGSEENGTSFQAGQGEFFFPRFGSDARQLNSGIVWTDPLPAVADRRQRSLSKVSPVSPK